MMNIEDEMLLLYHRCNCVFLLVKIRKYEQASGTKEMPRRHLVQGLRGGVSHGI